MRLPRFLLALTLLSPPAFAQHQDTAGDPNEELRRLFYEVEDALTRIDIELADAGAGETSLAEVEDSGLDDLLRQTMERSSQAQLKIDRILEIAMQMSQQSGSGGGGQPKPGQSPLDEQRDRSPQQRENTPDAPEEDGQEHEDPEDTQPRGNQPEEGPERNPLSGENRPGDEPDNPSGDPVPHGDETDGWGFLPERVREVFRNQGRDDLPVRYRDWIDAYYRRLSRSSR